MILTCPDCATSYFVDDAKIPAAGREVRCASCGTKWHATHDQPSPAVAAAEPEPLTAAIEPPVLRRNSKPDALPKTFRAKAEAKKNVKQAAAAGAVWAGMGLVLVAMLGAAYLFRIDVVRMWPRTASAYAELKIPVNALGLEFEDVESRPALKDGHAALILTGKIRNTKDKAVESPPLKIELFDKAGKRIAVKNADPENPLIPPGEARHFTVSLLDPPLAAEDAQVGFAMDRKVAHRPAAAVAAPGSGVGLRGPVIDATPTSTTPGQTAPAGAAPADPVIPPGAKPLPGGAPHAIAPGNG
jgi:predicted Zn finger-like uncharacterized protein